MRPSQLHVSLPLVLLLLATFKITLGFERCNLCWDGSPITEPDYLSVINTINTCQDLNDLLAELDTDSKFCNAMQSEHGVACGCPVYGDQCPLCANGEPVPFPNKRPDPSFGNTCGEYSAKAAHSPYDKNSRNCYILQSSDDGRGCCPNRDVTSIIWTQRSAGIVSLFGSLFIIMSILTKPKKVRWSTYNQIVLGISIFDSLSSTAYIIGPAFAPNEYSFGNNLFSTPPSAGCVIQGWLFQIGIASVYYSVLLWVYFLLVVKYNWTERKFSKVAKWAHLGVVAVALIMAFAVIWHVGPDYRWLCYVESPFIDHSDSSPVPGIIFFLIPVSLGMTAMTVLTVIFVSYVLKVHRKTQSKTMNKKGKQRGSLASRTVWQSVWFLAVFYLVWPIQFVAFWLPRISSTYPIFLLAAIFGPLQGFLNALVVFCRDRKSIQRRVSQTTKKLLSFVSAKFTSAGSNEVVNAESAGGGGEAKPPVEYSVESEAAAQQEIGVGQLDDRLEEEGKTPEAASDGEGDESDEDYDENDEGLLEHAINANILNDDDREIFRVSIARIQSTSVGTLTPSYADVVRSTDGSVASQ
jgi:hypothetical protein